MSMRTYPQTRDGANVVLTYILKKFDYDPVSGSLYKKGTQILAGGRRMRQRYVNGEFNQYAVSHIVWAIETGYFPLRTIRTVDGNPMNTHISNLIQMPRKRVADKGKWRDAQHLEPYGEAYKWAIANGFRDYVESWEITPLQMIAFT